MTIAMAHFDRLCQLIHRETGITLARGKEYLVESRIKPLARTSGFDTAEQFVEHVLRTNDVEHINAVIDAMTTNETSFLRDKHPFDALCDHVLPPLITARQAQRKLRIWSAACSTGQEPYTIAMLLQERFPQLRCWDVRILATDLSTTVLDQARAGRFSQLEINRGLPARWALEYFDRDGASWVAKDELRQRISFRQLNLIDPLVGIPQSDVIFLRNVLIYFDGSTKTRVLDGVHDLLAPDGALFMGAAESTIGFSDRYEQVLLGKSTCYRPRS